MIRQRAASDRDRASWFAAAEVGNCRPPAVSSREGLIRELSHRNPVRMRRVRNDFKWMQKQLTKMGLNPEDARWLL